jgi:hypothetical protein
MAGLLAPARAPWTLISLDPARTIFANCQYLCYNLAAQVGRLPFGPTFLRSRHG